MASSTVQSPAPTNSSPSTTKISPIVIGISAAGAALILILIMAGICLIMQRKRDHNKSSSSSSTRGRDGEQRPVSMRSGKTISQPSNPRKNVLLTEPMPSPMMVQLPAQPPPSSVLLPSQNAAAARRPTNTSIPDRSQSQSIDKRQYTHPRPQPRHGTTSSSLVPSFVTNRSEYDLSSVQSPTASSDLNHSRSFHQQQPPPPMPMPISSSSLANTNLSRRVDPVSTTTPPNPMGYTEMRAQSNISYAPTPPPTIQQQPPPRTEERVRADLLAALESNEPVLVVKRPIPAVQSSSRRGHQFL